MPSYTLYQPKAQKYTSLFHQNIHPSQPYPHLHLLASDVHSTWTQPAPSVSSIFWISNSSRSEYFQNPCIVSTIEETKTSTCFLFWYLWSPFWLCPLMSGHKTRLYHYQWPTRLFHSPLLNTSFRATDINIPDSKTLSNPTLVYTIIINRISDQLLFDKQLLKEKDLNTTSHQNSRNSKQSINNTHLFDVLFIVPISYNYFIILFHILYNFVNNLFHLINRLFNRLLLLFIKYHLLVSCIYSSSNFQL